MTAHRRAPAPRCDFHIHTTGSDGRYDLDEVLRLAAYGGLDVIAVTDHDLAPTHAAGEQIVHGHHLTVVHGAEVSARLGDHELHLLVWFGGVMPAEFAGFLRERSAARAERYDLVRERIGLDGLEPADAAARAGTRALSRHHLARALVDAGHASNVSQAFRRWLGRDRGLVPLVEVTAASVIERARASGGVVGLAHPTVEQESAHVPALVDVGLQALEVSRPGLGPSRRNRLLRLAHRHGLLPSGGSDFHGWRGPPLGQFGYPWREARSLASALGLEAA